MRNTHLFPAHFPLYTLNPLPCAAVYRSRAVCRRNVTYTTYLIQNLRATVPSTSGDGCSFRASVVVTVVILVMVCVVVIVVMVVIVIMVVTVVIVLTVERRNTI